MKNKEYIDINKIAELKGLKSNRSLRLAIQKGKYVARVVKVFGGKSYEILYSSLEPEIQEKLQDELIKEATQSNCTALVPINNINNNIYLKRKELKIFLILLHLEDTLSTTKRIIIPFSWNPSSLPYFFGIFKHNYKFVRFSMFNICIFNRRII